MVPKCHHVMKLYKINKKDTRQWMTSTHWVPVDPADLEKLGLGYYGLVQEIKKRLAKPEEFDLDSEVFDRTNSYTAMACDAIIKTIADLESGLPAQRSAVIKARAMQIMEERANSQYLKDKVRGALAQARFEVEAGRDTGEDESFACTDAGSDKSQDVKGETNEKG